MRNVDLTTSNITFTKSEVGRLRNFGCISRSGVVYHEELAGPNGMSFLLIREEDTTEDMLKQAVDQLRRDRDVVGIIRVAKAVASEDSMCICSDCGAEVETIIGCPDGAEVCSECFNSGRH